MLWKKYKNIGIANSDCINKEYKRASKDKVFMDVALAVSKRSHDSNTQHGCCIVKDDRIISTGYNGFPAGSPDYLIPNNRYKKLKYLFMNHAEENAILSCARNGISLYESKIFISGLPCKDCSRKLVSVGILDWTVGNIGHVSTKKEDLLREFWIEVFGVNITRFSE
jgi:dCMP deaminase